MYLVPESLGGFRIFLSVAQANFASSSVGGIPFVDRRSGLGVERDCGGTVAGRLGECSGVELVGKLAVISVVSGP